MSVVHGRSRLWGCFRVLHGRAIAGIAPVVVGIVGGESLEATVYPEILFGYAANVRLQQGVEALDVANRVDAGKVLERGPDHDAISGVAGQSFREVGQHGGAGNARQTRCGSGGGGRNPEKLHHRRTLVAVALIRRVPHRFIVFEGANHGAYVVVSDRFAVTREAGEHGVRQHGVFRGAIHHVERYDGAEDAGGDFDGGEMAADHDGAAAPGERRLQILEALNLGEPVYAAVAAPPGIGRLAETQPEALAVAGHQIWLLPRPQPRHAQLDDLAAPGTRW